MMKQRIIIDSFNGTVSCTKIATNDLGYAPVAHCGRKCVARHIFDHAGAKATITGAVGYGA